MDHVGAPVTRGLRVAAILIGLLSVVWGWRLGVRPVLAYGVAQLTVLSLLWLYPRVALRGAGLRRAMNGTACEEDDVPVRFTLTNRSLLPLFVPEIEDRFTPDKVQRRLAFVYPTLGPRQAAEASYQGNCFARRGRYVIGPAQVRLSCPTGLFSAAVPEDGLATLVVYPTLERLPPFPSGGTGIAPSLGGHTRRDAGEGDVALGAREYRPGDALRRIHWPTTARRGRLSILEYERQQARRLTIMIDLARSSLRGLGRQATVEVAVRIAAAVAGHTLDRGDRVALEACDRGGPIHIPAGRGRAHLVRMLEVLALVKADGALPLSRLVDERLPTLVRGQSILLVVSDAEDDGPLLLEQVTALRTRGCEVVVALLDPESFPRIWDRSGPPGLPFVELAEGFVARGAQVYRIEAGASLADAFLHPWGHRRRVFITPAMLGSTS